MSHSAEMDSLAGLVISKALVYLLLVCSTLCGESEGDAHHMLNSTLRDVLGSMGQSGNEVDNRCTLPNSSHYWFMVQGLGLRV